ncbi:hypothetical protein G9A89_021980 [Geosiphon pyriformis]|nr:hypothetical protein G9A89_021980 [Geosiphon pyriformis]
MSFELGKMAVFELWVSDKLFVAVVVDILLVVAVDKLKIDIWMVDILAVVSLASKLIDMVLVGLVIRELKTGNWGFDIDFLIVGYLSLIYSQLLNAFVYHSSGKHASSAVTVDWLKMIDMTDSGNNSHFLDYCIVVEINRLPDWTRVSEIRFN